MNDIANDGTDYTSYMSRSQTRITTRSVSIHGLAMSMRDWRGLSRPQCLRPRGNPTFYGANASHMA